jgi:hypothetical protein
MIYNRVMSNGVTDSGAYLSTGTGWVSAPNYTPPRAISADSMNEQGVRFVDVNGDGLVDMIYNLYSTTGPSSTGAYLNTGTGWVSAPNFIPPHAIASNVMKEMGVRFVDVNGDGLVDMIYHRYMCAGTDAGAYLNTGSGWVSAANFTPPHAISADCMNELGVRFVDVDGDGLADMIYNRYINSSAIDSGAYLLKANFDRVTSIASGLGAATSPAYKPLTDSSVYTKDSGVNKAVYPYMDIQAPLYVVSSANVPNGIGGTRNTTYQYYGAKTLLTGGGFLGFRQHDVTDASTGIKTSTLFRQDYPLQGLPTQVKVIQSNGSLLKQITNTWNYATYADTVLPLTATTKGSKHNFPYLSNSVESNWDLNGAVFPPVTTTNTYDPAYGNVSTVAVSTPDGYSKTTTHTYTNDLVNWYLGRLTQSTVTSTTP